MDHSRVEVADVRSMDYSRYPQQPVSPDSDLQGMTLNEFLSILLASRWIIVSAVSLFSLAGLIYLLLAEPIYRSDALLKVEQSAGAKALGSDSSNLSGNFEDSTISTEIALVKSRKILGEVVDNFDLDVRVIPESAPYIGRAINWIDGLTTGLQDTFGIDLQPWTDSTWGQYPRDEEYIDVLSFNVPNEFNGKKFTLVTGLDNTYELEDSDGNVFEKGQGYVGKLLEGFLPTEQPHELMVSAISARPGTRFHLTLDHRQMVVANLSRSLAITPLGGRDAADSSAGLVRISLEGPDPEKIAAIINNTIDIYVSQNAKGKLGEIKRAMAVIEEQLPVIRQRVKTAEAALIDYRLKHESVDLDLETRSMLDRSVNLENEIHRLRSERQETLQLFTVEHQEVIAIDRELADLYRRKKVLEKNINQLPQTEHDILQLTRNVEVNREIYTLLQKRVQELRIIEAGTSGSVRIVDRAEEPLYPVGPSKTLALVVFPSLGMMLGIGLSLLRKALRRDFLDDPDTVEKQLGLPVYAIVPHSPFERKHSKDSKRNGTRRSVLSVSHSQDPAIESLKSLRLWLEFSFQEAQNNILLVTGATPGVGKSFVSVNLAAVLANNNKRLLLIDADLRRGGLHRCFDCERVGGLSEAITGILDINEVIHETEIENLSFISTGILPPNSSELLQEKGFSEILTKLSELFDYVIVDSPPILAVNDAAAIGRLATGTLLVVRENAHSMNDLAWSTKTLRQTGVNVLGVVFNGMGAAGGRRGYGKYYNYNYSSDYAAS